jgi:putative ATP-dependent endonuclease of OLD family
VRIKLFSVTKFRSITKAEKLPLGDLTVLIGPNNEGKSNILEALAMGMQHLSNPTIRRPRAGTRARYRADYERSEELVYEWARDFPQTLQDNLEGRTTMSFDFELTAEEVAEFYREVGSRFNDTLPLSLSFGRTGAPSFRIRKQGQAQKILASKGPEIAQFVAARVQVQYVPAVRTGGRVSAIVRRMLSRELASAERDPEYASALERLREVQKPILEELSRSITARLQSLLPDVRSVSIDQDAERVMTRGVAIVVDDGTPTDLSLKGDGVQSLAALAMMQHYSRETARAREFILAVEEPEAHLHPSAIHALRDTLRETAEKQQVVVTTHSPLFVNRLDLASNIIVTRNRAAPATSVKEIREVLGVHVADNLAAAEVVCVVEGIEDETALRGLLPHYSVTLAEALEHGVLAITPLHGANKLNYLLAQLRDSLAAVHALFDNDEAGKTAAESAEAAGLLTTADITFAMCPGAKKESEFEDIVASDIYSEAFFEQFGVNVDHPWVDQLSKGKWSRRMPTVFRASGTEWNDTVQTRAKAAVAKAVLDSPGSAIKPSCTSVVSALVASLEDKLARRSG